MFALLLVGAKAAEPLTDYSFQLDEVGGQKDGTTAALRIDVHAKSASFGLVGNLNRGAPFKAYVKRIEIAKAPAFNDYHEVESHALPIEWYMEPLMVSNRSTALTVDLSDFIAELVNDALDGRVAVRIKWARWIVGKESRFAPAGYFISEPFVVRVDQSGHVVRVESMPRRGTEAPASVAQGPPPSIGNLFPPLRFGGKSPF